MFTHLHVHSEYSLLDGLCRIPELVARARDLGMEHLALTDHGALYGALEFYQECRAAGINPIVGCELYVARDDHRMRTAAEKSSSHLTVLARDLQGYRNLLRLVTAAHLEGFYYKPRVDRQLLEQHREGLIVLTGCPSAEIPSLIQEGRWEEARQAARWYRERFDDLFLEIQDHGDPQMARLYRDLVSFAREADLPLVATNDVHYVHQSQAAAQDLLVCIQTNTTVEDEKRLKLYGESFFLKSGQEMAALFQELPEAIANTQRIAERCHLELEFGRLNIPDVPLPPGTTPDQHLADLCWAGASRLYPTLPERVRQRLEYELEVVQRTHFAPYFLVVQDLVQFARSRGILLGVRGSAAASAVLYCLGVTEVDPLEYGLVFERFLNLERREVPDIDLDFQDDRRDEVLHYAVQRYGRERVAHIITFGTLGARAALRDVGRALNLPYAEVDRVARLVPANPAITLERALRENEELRYLHLEDPTIQRLIEAARSLEGIARHASTHAAGVVLSREPLTEVVPLQRAARGDEESLHTTQYAMEPIATLGLLKVDLLGLVNLTILDKTRQFIRQTRGIEVDPQHLPLDDAATYRLLAAGETQGLFQLEGAGMTRWTKELKPSSLQEIAALIALYRPGPMQHIPTYIRAKHGQEAVSYPHEALASLLEGTYGVIVFQDQVLLIAQAFAGYSLGEADVMRKAMGKKIPQVMRDERQRFIQGAVSRGFREEDGAHIFDLIEPFAGYAFNKAHAVSYALLSYQTAYFKANYPAEFIAALMTAYGEHPEKVAGATAEAQRLGIPVLPPDLNRSEVSFTLEPAESGWAIRFGLACIKNVGGAAAAALVEARRKGPYLSLQDLCRRLDLRLVNKRVLESLTKAGALDLFGPRGALLSASDRLLSLAQQEQRRRETGQTSMFDLFGQEVPVPLGEVVLGGEEVPMTMRLAWEKELTGVYLSEHPFQRAFQELRTSVTLLSGGVIEEMHGQTVTVAGVVRQVRRLTTKTGRTFLAITLEDLEGSLEVTVWPELHDTTQELWVQGAIVVVHGRVRAQGDRVQVICDRATLYQPREESLRALEEEAHPSFPTGRTAAVPEEPAPVERPRRLVLRLLPTGDEGADVERLHQLMGLLRERQGPDEVRIAVLDGEGPVWLDPGVSVRVDEGLRRRLVGLLGESGVTVEAI